MEIRPPTRESSGRASRGVSRPASRLVLVLLAGCILVFAASVVTMQVLAPGALRSSVHKAAVDIGYGYGGEQTLAGAFRKLPARFVEHLFDRPDIPTLVLDINFRNLSMLGRKREEALRLGYLVQDDEDFVPASIRTGDRTIQVRLRLKGDMTDHLRTDKWSFRIHTRGDDHIFGLRRFSIQHPMTRGFQAEVLFFATLGRLGVLAPRYFFADVVVNGSRIGLMAVEEHFSKELLEHNGRADGVILRFDESLMWADRVARGRLAVNDTGPFDNYVNAPITTFRTSTILESEPLRQQYEVAAGLLRGFADGEIGAAEVFDVQALGRFLAAAELWGAWHAATWNNLRFYFDPLTMRLEPIGYDASLGHDIDPDSISAPGTLMSRMLEDPAVRAVFDETLATLKEQVEHGELIRYLETIQAKALKELRSEYYLLEAIDLGQLEARAGRLPFEVNATGHHEPYGAHVLPYLITKGGENWLELLNPLPHEVEIVGIDWVGPAGRLAAFEPVERVTYPVQLAPMDAQGKRRAVRLAFVPPTFEGDVRLEVSSRIRHEAEIKTTAAIAAVPPLLENPLPAGDAAELLQRHPFLSVSAAGEELAVAAGRWRLDGSLVLPTGWALRVAPGTTLQFGPHAALIAYGPVTMEGSGERPILLEPWPEADTWQGIVVHGAPRRSEWTHVTIRNTGGVRWSSWLLTGGTTFYRSDLKLSHASFTGNRAEDALNIIHSRFELAHVDVADTASDGIDSDFCVGRIQDSSFVNIGFSTGADAIDVSGSDVTLQRIRFSGVSDKAVSVGEGSRVVASELSIENSIVAAASKDGSTLEISDSTVSHAALAGLMSYVKKPEYGAASLLAQNVTTVDTPVPAQAQRGSILELNGRKIDAEEIDVDALYETHMKKATLQ